MRYNTSENRFRYYKSTTYTQQQPVQLYKRVHTTQTHSIHFNSNGGSGTMNDQTVNEFEPTALQDNTFTREGFVFEGWNTAVDGTGDYYADGASVTLLNDLTLYAQWDQLFTITLVQANHGSISASALQAFAEAEIVLTATPDYLYALDHWTVTDTQGNNITVTENSFEMPASDVTVSAVFSYSSQSFVQEYQLVTSVDQLIAGRTYLIVNIANGKALGTTQNNNNRSASSVTIEDGIIHSIDNTVCELTLGGSIGAWTFFDAGWGNNGGYLYAASSSNNYLRTQASNDANGQWSIDWDANGVATIQAQGNNSRNLLKFNNSSNIFACYESGQLEVCLFRRTEIYDYPAEQTFNLAQGWNWWSTHLDITLNDLKDALVAALPNGAIVIKAQDGKRTTYNGSSWKGQLSILDVKQMYEIQVSGSCSIILNGTPVNPADNAITLYPNGYTWIAYSLNESLSVSTALQGIQPAPENGDMIKAQNGFASFNGTSWKGSLKTLEPGKGYIYKSASSQTKTLTYTNR
jgi:uncharacterized repeat protein (TIGR02543 family)